MNTLKKYFADIMFVALVVLAIFFWLMPAHSEGTTANLSFTPKLTYTDNTTFPASDIKNITVTWANAPGQPFTGGPVLVTLPTNYVAGSLVTTPIPVLCGTRVFRVVTVMQPTALYPVPSAPADSNNYDSGVKCAPLPPTGVTVS